MSFVQKNTYVEMLKLVLNVKYLLLLYFLTAAEFYHLGHIQGIIRVSTLTQKRSFLVICTILSGLIFESAEKIKTNIQH